jgi:hypothetical protein
MDTVQEHQGEPERREGPGEQARRFGDTELSWVRDKHNRGAETPPHHPGDPDLDPVGRGDVTHRDSRPAPETHAPETHAPETHAPETHAPETHAPETRAPEPPQAGEPDRASDSELVATRTGGDPERPVRAASSDAEPEPGHQPAGSEELPGRSGGQAAADDSAARVGLLGNAASLRDQWQQVQGTFVDDPQRAVHEASVLVERTLDELRVNVTRGHTSDTTSTEDLRISFQRYREFFQRLLSA